MSEGGREGGREGCCTVRVVGILPPLLPFLLPSLPFLKQGLMEVDEQWATHKKLIQTKVRPFLSPSLFPLLFLSSPMHTPSLHPFLQGRPLRACVPKSFPYFYAEWGEKGEGYAHIIEDRAQFPKE